MNENELIEVHQMREDEKIKSESLKWPQKYEDFIKDIIQKFKLRKNAKIELQLITDDGDDFEIRTQEQLNDFADTPIKQFNFLTTGEPDEVIDEDDNFNPKPIEEIKIQEIDIDDLMKEVFNFEEYKEKMNLNTQKFTQDFQNDLEKNINEILNENQKNIENDINLKLSEYLNNFQNENLKMKNSVLNINEDLDTLKEITDGMCTAIKDLNHFVVNEKLIISAPEALKNNEENRNSILKIKPEDKLEQKKNELEISEVINPNPIEGYYDDVEKKILKIDFARKYIEKIIDVKESKFININDIKIINSGERIAKSLYFVIDKEKSSNELCFYGNLKETNKYDISLQNEFGPKKDNPCSLSLSINNPQPDKEYKMIIYVEEKGKKVSDDLQIVIKIKKAEDPMQQKKKQANEIFNEIKNQFPNNEDLINKENIINALIKNNLNKDEIINDIKNKIYEKEQLIINEKAEIIFNELNFDNVNLDKKEVLDKIKESKLNKEEVQNWINEKKPKPEPNSEPEQNNDLVDTIYNELEEEYGISGFLEEELAKQKIKDFGCDKPKIIQWIENSLINGDQ